MLHPEPAQAQPSFPLPLPPNDESSSSAVREDDPRRDPYEHQHFPNYDHQHFRNYEHHHFRNYEQDQLHLAVSPTRNFNQSAGSSEAAENDTCSCVMVILTFWFFVSMTLICGVYGTETLRLGSGCSILSQHNPIFVQSLKVEERDVAKQGPVLYGFYNRPALSVIKTWSELINSSVQADSYKEWMYYLNENSHINISYTVRPSSSSLFLIIAQGNEELSQWLENPTYPDTTLSWNAIHGSGVIEQGIPKSYNYYIALGNLNPEDVEVQLNLRVRASLYNTTDAYYKCTFINGQCNLNVLFPRGNFVVLTTPIPEKGATSSGWFVTLSYGPRWITYVAGTGVMTVAMLLAIVYLNKFQRSRQGEMAQDGGSQPDRTPLLREKDEDLTSCGSSYDSASHDENDLEDRLAAGSPDGKPIKDGENSNNTRRLCAICFDAPRDCFFIPCGHCVACFECGTRIAEAAGTCPICRRKMKKVRKIYTV